ncbi:MAG: hypothetical protein OSB19_10780 [Opitutaceae bacterium]|nr:hypothetical protein [Opitutaceae bacterium]
MATISPVVVVMAIASVAGAAVKAAPSVMRYPHAVIPVNIVSGVPIAMAMAVTVVMDRPISIDPSLDGNRIVMATASAMVASVAAVMADRYVTSTAMVAVVVIIDNRSDYQPSDDSSD